MVISLIIDVIAAAVIILAAAIGKKRGLVKMLWRCASWIITIILAVILSAPVSALLADSEAAHKINSTIKNTVEEYISSAALNNTDTIQISDKAVNDIAHSTGIPAILIPSAASVLNTGISNGINSISDNISDIISNAVMRVASWIILMIIIKIIISILYHALNIASKLPLINTANRTFGALLGVINALFLIYISLAVVLFLVQNGTIPQRIIENTYLVKYFYNNNILLYALK